MKKRDIRVIKRDAEDINAPSAPTAEQVLIQEQKDKAEDNRGLAQIVKTWITDRRESSEAERLDAQDSRVAWNDEPAEEPPS
jgi:hypothetical protein